MTRFRISLAAAALLFLATRPASAFNIPPFATDHEVFQAQQADQNQDPGPTQCNGQGSPVDVATGNFTQTLTVFSMSGRGGLGVDVRLTYNGLDRRKGPFGSGWTSTYDQRVIKATDGISITAICANALGRR